MLVPVNFIFSRELITIQWRFLVSCRPVSQVHPQKLV